MGVVHTGFYDIFTYWRNKKIAKSGEVFCVDSCEEGEPAVLDLFTPCCWCCGKQAKIDLSKYENETLTDEQILESIWKRGSFKNKIQRAHIIPSALGGEDIPENLFLLCPDCHFLSPDTKNKPAFFRWIINRRAEFDFGIQTKGIISELELEVNSRGLGPVWELLLFLPGDTARYFGYDRLSKYLMANVGAHTYKVAHSSLIIGAVDWMLEEVKIILQDSPSDILLDLFEKAPNDLVRRELIRRLPPLDTTQKREEGGDCDGTDKP